MGIKGRKKRTEMKASAREYYQQEVTAIKKYPLNGKSNPKEVFDFPFLVNRKTIYYMREHGRVMFIIRGPPYTKKTQLSDLLKKTYPNAAYFSAVKYLDELKAGTKYEDHKSAVIASIDKCTKLVKEECEKNSPIIIVQNSHMQKFEMEPFLYFAALHDYAVVMAITTYRFDITPEAFKDKGNILDIEYLKKRIDQWEDVLPAFTGWFVSQNDSDYVRSSILKTLKKMTSDVNFSEQFNADDVKNYFLPRKVLCCLAGSTHDAIDMKKYYLNVVQSSYGKCFTLKLIGYLITASDVFGIIQLTKEMKSLILNDTKNSKAKLSNEKLRCLVQHGKTSEFTNEHKSPLETTVTEQKWHEHENIDINMCSFIHIAQKGFNLFDEQNLKNDFQQSLKSIADNDDVIWDENYDTLSDGITKYCELPNKAWLIKVPEKICMSSIFTGFYEA